MSFIIRQVENWDLNDLHSLATSLSTHGFLTLPSKKEDLEELISLSQKSFGTNLKNRDQGKYLFVLEDVEKKEVVGSSLVVARHGTSQSPHLFFQVDPKKKTLTFQFEIRGRTELGGLILHKDYRGHPAKLGKCLSLVRLLYIRRHPERFHEDLLAELLPPFAEGGRSYFWESLGRKLTGMDYQEADELSKKDKAFVFSHFPQEPIPIDSLTPEAQKVIGVAGPETLPVVKILTSVGFEYLNQIDPFDGGPHYGAKRDEIRYKEIQDFFDQQKGIQCPMLS